MIPDPFRQDHTQIMDDPRAIKEQKHFDQLARETGEVWWGSTTPAGQWRKRRRAELICAALATFPDPLVIELGCGTGALTRYLLEIRPSLRLVGLDVSPICVRQAIERFPYPNAVFQVGNAYELPLRDGIADAVAGASVLHHLDVRRALRECGRVLKPGGLLWFSEPNMMNPQVALEKNIRAIGAWLQNSEDETAFFRWSLAKQLREAGFTDVRVRPYDFMHPLIPSSLIPWAGRVGRWLEAVPLLREISGSLQVQARKPS